MKRTYFYRIEKGNFTAPLQLNAVIEQLAFNEQKLIPVITQDANSKDVLMLAWMNKEAILQTISTRRMIYWSRSREQLWEKGESSGHSQTLVSMSFDCDGDAILCQVHQNGCACHTGRMDCFYLKVNIENRQVDISGNIVCTPNYK